VEDVAEGRNWQPVAHNVFDDRRLPAVVEPVGMLPDAIWTVHLLVYEPDGRLPAGDARLPAQRNPEQAEPVVDQDSFLHRDRLRREDPEVKFRRGDVLQVGRVGEEGEHPLARQRHIHGRRKNVECHASHCTESAAKSLH